MARRRKARRRTRRRNAWKGDKAGHRKAALKGWRKRKRRKSSSRGRKRRRTKRRNPGRRVGRRGARRRGRRRNRSRRRNPGTALSLRRPVRALTAGFNVKTLSRAAVITGGALGNAWLTGAVGSFLPDMLTAGPGSYVTGLASAGVLGAGAGMISPKMAGDVFFGGVIEVMTRAVREYIVPMLPGLSGMGDYLTVANAREAQPLGYMGDYLTVNNAREAQPLGGYGEGTVAEELAAYA